MTRRSYEATTRRQFVKIGAGTALATGAAGCIGETDSSSSDGSYSVMMAPMGEVEFESVPESWMAYFSTYGDMAIALGQLDGLEGLIFTDNWPLAFYDYLPDFDMSFDDIPQLMGENGIDKELFYEMDSDVHLFDPNFIQLLDDTWTDEDFEEIATQVGPIVGNSIRRRGEDWHDYEYYSLYEAFEKIATVFDERERYDELASVHDEFISGLQDELPPESERPEIGLVSVNSDFEGGSFYTYPITEGNGKKQYHELGIRDAFAKHIDGGYAKWDYEQLLDVDPDIIVFSYGFSHVSTEEFEQRIQQMHNDPAGSKLSAVQNDRLYRGGTSYQGPIINLFQTEAAAKQFYPDTFGEWNGLDSFSSNPLFDRQAVADVVNGEF
ncbi:iron complex transport system substrate-binding protein [Natronoarchaeum philippinense]|uniref:Iron complex transport system substrate-binding protein n=1 Tax=Natronoarchaeum philippinense TaxID=558529 RepID=A0A285P3F0_NATPI|nr:ABC transporter substrate-binding protein [Natronoarchaeum philippinense]SNZ15968.1 iron complex transport system substrate-binding protein [Natronoarchaeum philippinense]